MAMARKAISKTPLGRRLTEVREARGYSSRAEFAEYLGMNAETLGGYERGDTAPNIEFLVMYRDRFGVRLDWLLAGDGEMYENAVLNTVMRKFRADPVGKVLMDEVDADLLVRIANTVRVAHDRAGIKLPRESDLRPIAAYYNTFVAEGGDLTDPTILDRRLESLREKLTKQLSEAAAAPGTGKREAS